MSSQFRVWPDDTVQEVDGSEPYSHMSDDFATVTAEDEEDALRKYYQKGKDDA